jgi:hypothetical protein
MSRSHVGIYMGKSTRHLRNVGLVLNPATGMISPQYHLRYDDTFETVRGIREASHGTWRSKCYFIDSVPTAEVNQKESDKIIKKKLSKDTPTRDIAQEEVPTNDTNILVNTGPNEIFAADEPVVTNEIPMRENEGATEENSPAVPTPQPQP